MISQHLIGMRDGTAKAIALTRTNNYDREAVKQELARVRAALEEAEFEVDESAA